MKEAAAQEGVGQFLFIVGRDDDDRALLGTDGFTGLVNVKLHAIQLLEQVVGKLDIRLVDLIDQQHDALAGGERFPELAGLDVVGDVFHTLDAELRIAQAADRVVLVKPLGRLGAGLDVPGDQLSVEGRRQLLGQQGLARARLAFDQ